jgi:predicted site-specific integrase-resolvase
MKPSRVLKVLNITRKTLYNYVKSGKVHVSSLPRGRYEYSDEDVAKLAGMQAAKEEKVVYIRAFTKEACEEQLKSMEPVEGYVVMQDIAKSVEYDKFFLFYSLLSNISKRNITEVKIYNERVLGSSLFCALVNICRISGCRITTIVPSIPHGYTYESETLAIARASYLEEFEK